jgi:putative FmdB family regulatory protein
MPLYEYQCQSCGKRTEVLQSFAAAPRTVCEACGGDLKKLISAPAVQFKGTGWYVTDYAGKKGSGKSEGKSEGGAEGKSDGGSKESSGSSESKSEGKSESKSEGKSESKSEAKSESKSESKPESKSSGGASGD